LGYDKLDDYINDPYFLGSSIGRTAGRIKGASFELENNKYNLEKNDSNNLLHGGKNGFHSLIWNYHVVSDDKTVGVKFSRTVKSSEDMFPGDISVEISYLLNNNNELELSFKGSSNRKTLFNPTNHAYFNLDFDKNNYDILKHYLTLDANEYLETDEFLIPTGARISVKNSAYDFTKERLIDDSLKILTKKGLKGLDTPFCLNNNPTSVILKNADKSRSISISTDRNSIVVYTSNYFEDKQRINGIVARPYMGIALEAQTLPDAIHHKNFGDIVMGEETKEYKTIIRMCQSV
jgi:aldose 1-epimerase